MTKSVYLNPGDVALIKRLAARAPGFTQSDELDRAVSWLSPMAIEELCDAWREREGIVRRADVLDVKAESERAGIFS
jgi:hypothetical protein